MEKEGTRGSFHYEFMDFTAMYMFFFLDSSVLTCKSRVSTRLERSTIETDGSSA
jgi:hypothetical protein